MGTAGPRVMLFTSAEARKLIRQGNKGPLEPKGHRSARAKMATETGMPQTEICLYRQGMKEKEGKIVKKPGILKNVQKPLVFVVQGSKGEPLGYGGFSRI